MSKKPIESLTLDEWHYHCYAETNHALSAVHLRIESTFNTDVSTQHYLVPMLPQSLAHEALSLRRYLIVMHYASPSQFFHSKEQLQTLLEVLNQGLLYFVPLFLADVCVNSEDEEVLDLLSQLQNHPDYNYLNGKPFNHQGVKGVEARMAKKGVVGDLIPAGHLLELFKAYVHHHQVSQSAADKAAMKERLVTVAKTKWSDFARDCLTPAKPSRTKYPLLSAPVLLQFDSSERDFLFGLLSGVPAELLLAEKQD